MTGRPWLVDSWREFPAAQQPEYPDAAALAATLARLRTLPALVAFDEIDRTRRLLAEAATGQRFVLQGGDCAERFADCSSVSIMAKLRILLQMSFIISYGARKPVMLLARLGGQYAKPRSSDDEEVHGARLPVFRGDNVNDLAPTAEARRPDPFRLQLGYFHAAATVNLLRALADAGFGAVSAAEQWQLDWMQGSEAYSEFSEIADRVRDAIDYLEHLGGVRRFMDSLDCHVSHEGLLLDYEQAMTRFSKWKPGQFYNLGAHFLWIGERTRRLDGAHVEYFRGISNPIGVKVGPSCEPAQLSALVERLDPAGNPGRLTLITRLGRDAAAQKLPALIRAVGGTGRRPLWICDPMHGNTLVAAAGLKTRRFADILSELRTTFEVHRSEGSALNGVHFELTGENVTECTGGAENLGADDLRRQYETACDPRLNYNQGMEMAFLIGRLLQQQRAAGADS